MIASMASSTVTMPSILPASSTTGTAKRSYFAIVDATSTAGRLGLDRDEIGLHDAVDEGRRQREQQRSQRERAEQMIVLVEHVEVVDELRSGRDLANLADRRFGRAVRIDPHVIGRHHSAGRILGILDEFAQLAGRVRVHLGEQLRLLLFRKLGEQIGGVVGVHLFDDVGGALGADVFDQALARLGIEMLERVGRRFVVELADDGERLRATRDRR